jgi:hypothetical protein
MPAEIQPADVFVQVQELQRAVKSLQNTVAWCFVAMLLCVVVLFFKTLIVLALHWFQVRILRDVKAALAWMQKLGERVEKQLTLTEAYQALHTRHQFENTHKLDMLQTTAASTAKVAAVTAERVAGDVRSAVERVPDLTANKVVEKMAGASGVGGEVEPHGPRAG